jgi:ABC-type branched-subunit amino acid transport system substrate-binding protein
VRKTGFVALALIAAGTAAAAATVAAAGPRAATKPCSFNLRIGDVLPFTGGLAAYGANLDQAVKVAIGLDNAALKRDGLSKRIKVTLVGSEDGQTDATASVEAATKLVKSNHANVIIGAMVAAVPHPKEQVLRRHHSIVCNVLM